MVEEGILAEDNLPNQLVAKGYKIATKRLNEAELFLSQAQTYGRLKASQRQRELEMEEVYRRLEEEEARKQAATAMQTPPEQFKSSTKSSDTVSAAAAATSPVQLSRSGHSDRRRRQRRNGCQPQSDRRHIDAYITGSYTSTQVQVTRSRERRNCVMYCHDGIKHATGSIAGRTVNAREARQ